MSSGHCLRSTFLLISGQNSLPRLLKKSSPSVVEPWINPRRMRRSIFILAIVCAATLTAAAVDQKDVEYTRPGGKPVLLDLHVPDGPGPFPAAILIHGGGFDEGSRSTNVKPLFDVL